MARTLNELLDVINATDPESGEEFLKLLEPEKYDRYEMGSIMEATIGNDLTSYYDKKTIADYLDIILKVEDVPDELKEYIEDNREEIIERAYTDYDDANRDLMLISTTEAYLEEQTGYDVNQFIDDEMMIKEKDKDEDVLDEDEPIDDSEEEEEEENENDD